MKKSKIALFIMMFLLASAMLATAAEPLTDIVNNPYKKDIEDMVDLGVLSGKGDGKFDPSAKLTRAEAAKVAVVLAGFDADDVAQAAGLPQAFTDVYTGMPAHGWSLGWINLAASENLIAGHGDGKYGPGDNLQMVQWATILIRILGHDTAGLAWPAGYDQLARDLGLTSGLDYASSAYIKRDEMAKFTANAVYHAERPDGTKIIDLLEGKTGEPGESVDDPRDDEPDQDQEVWIEDINMTFDLSQQILAEGGGQTVSLTVTVTDKAGKPLEGAEVWINANAFESGERNSQLSVTEGLTNASGQLISKYTSLAADDKRMLEIEVKAAIDGAMEFAEERLMAANQAAIIEGQVRDPFTGAPVEDLNVNFLTSGNYVNVGFVPTDVNGFYSMVVPTGSYQVDFQMAIRDVITVSASNHGQTYRVDNHKGILKGVVSGAAPGSGVMAIDWSAFKDNNPDNFTLQADIQSDGSFVIALAPGNYELFVIGSPFAFKSGVNIQSGQVNDIGSAPAR